MRIATPGNFRRKYRPKQLLSHPAASVRLSHFIQKLIPLSGNATLPTVSGEKDTSKSFPWRAIFSRWQDGSNRDLSNPSKENRIHMAVLDSIVSASFRSEDAGRVVVFPGDRRHRGYVVKAPAEEEKIKSFLKMFYCAHFSILFLGYFLAFEWSRGIYRALGRPEAHMFRAMCISLGVYSLVAGVPYFLFWRSYKKAFSTFVSAQDEVLVSGKPVRRRARVAIGFGLIVLGLGILLAFAVSYKP
jgi:hypothetical protein